jgi:hypothetical protein
MKNQYTKLQLELLCQALIAKSADAYKRFGVKFNSILTTPKHYNPLAIEINTFAPVASGVKVKDTWLCSLFKRSREENYHKLENNLMDACCLYVSGKKALVYFENSFSIENYYGNYQIYWKGNTHNSENLNYKYEFDLEITADKATFWSVNDLKSSIYVGNSVLIGHNLYMELLHPKPKEKVYLIVHVGIADNLNYLSAIYAGVDNKPRPVSAIMLLVKKGVEPNTALLDEYFYSRYAQNALIRAKDIVEMNSMESNLLIKPLTELKNKKATHEKLSNIFGNWYIYTNSREAGSVHRGKLSIKSLTEMYLKSIKNEYSEGKIELKGSTIVLQFHNEKCFTVFILNVGHGSILNLQTEQALVTTTGVDQPFQGIGILEKVETEYEIMKAALLSPVHDVEAYNHLVKNEIIDKLNKKNNLYL